MESKYLDKFIKVKYKDRNDFITGILIYFNNDFTLLKYNIVDYVIDGFILLKTKNILKFKYSENEIFKENIFKLKGIDPNDNTLNFENISNIFEEISNKYGAFGFEFKDDSKYYVGKFIKIKGKYFYIQKLDVKGVWSEIEKFNFNKIRIINFDTDYINSLILYNKSLE